MSEKQEEQKPINFNIPTKIPEFTEDRHNTTYANFVNVGLNEADCCLTFMRKPRPMSLDLQAVQSGELSLELSPVNRVYINHQTAVQLYQALGKSLTALDSIRKNQQPKPN
jgi:hypothetical protein